MHRERSGQVTEGLASMPISASAQDVELMRLASMPTTASAQDVEQQSSHGQEWEEVEEGEEEEVDLRSPWARAREDIVMFFPHEFAIVSRRQLEFGGIISSALVVYNAYLMWIVPSTGLRLDWLLRMVCHARIASFFPRPFFWHRLHRMYGEVREQPTPQLVRERLASTIEWQSRGFCLSAISHSWLCLVPLLLYSSPQTDLTDRLGRHCKLCWLWFIGSRVLNALIFNVLRASNINRGMSHACLVRHTESVRFDKNWHSPGDTECGICLFDYEMGDHVRLLGCGHHFHVNCVDRWLEQYSNHCPFCRAVIGPTSQQSEKKDD
mmetsp:Transcript_35003/g.62992  ORF Transcript_35003/g.62992 Transcript_35003/m.62992 type:complete len:323 (+) Transcript_35003:37-1005(+)